MENKETNTALLRGNESTTKSDASGPKDVMYRQSAFLLIALFSCFSLAYAIMGFGRAPFDIEKGQGGLYRVDRNQCVNMAEFMLDGDFAFYSRETVDCKLTSEPGGQYNYPPVSGILEIPVVLLARAYDLPQEEIFDLSIIPFILPTIIAALFLVFIYERYMGKKFSSIALLLLGTFLFAGTLFYGVVEEGKFEGVVAFFALLGIFFLPKNAILSGICFGLASCTKQTAILFIMPTFFVLLKGRQYKQTLVWSMAIASTVLLIMAPFLIQSGVERIQLSLSKNMDLFRIQKETGMGFISWLITVVTGESEKINTFLQLYTNKLVLLMCMLASLFFVIKRNITLERAEQYFGLLSFCSFLFIIFGKFYSSGIYEIAPTFLFVLWAMAAQQTVFGVIILLLQAFLCCVWPRALYRDSMLLVLYFLSILYIWRVSLSRKNEGTVGDLPDAVIQ